MSVLTQRYTGSLIALACVLFWACESEHPAQTPDTSTTADTSSPPDDIDSKPDSTPTVDASPDTSNPPQDTALSDMTEPNQSTLTVMTLNLHCFKLDGTPYTSNGERWNAIAAFANQASVDVLLLQEACRSTASGSAIEQLGAALETATGSTWNHAWERAHLAWEGTPDEADEGLGILSRLPMSSPRSQVYHAQGALQRLVIATDIDAGALGSLTVATVHLDFRDDAARLQQARETANGVLVAAPDVNVLIGGDFNARATSPTLTAFADWGYRNLGDGTLGRPNRIDHMLMHRGAAWTLKNARMAFTGEFEPAISDHPAVLVELEPSMPQNVTVTTITGRIDVGFGNQLTIRGNRAPLDWNQGWPALPIASDLWRLRVTEWDADSVEFKTLLNDITWEQGPNVVLQAGSDSEHTPMFP